MLSLFKSLQDHIFLSDAKPLRKCCVCVAYLCLLSVRPREISMEKLNLDSDVTPKAEIRRNVVDGPIPLVG